MSCLRILGAKQLAPKVTPLTSCRWKSDGEDYQYMQKSKIPTLHFQKSLPRLPIPELNKTCSRYLNAQKPLLTEEEFNALEKLVKNFEANEGKDLQDKLKQHDKANKHTSYISKPWFDMYLTDRQPLPINYNPLIVFNPPTNAIYNNQLIRATNFVISSLRFMKSLRKNILEPEVYHLDPKKSDTDTFRTVTRMLPPALSWYGAYYFKAFPLDMSQYSSLFNSTRVPQTGRDILSKDESARHLCVSRNGHYFVFEALDKNGDILKPEEILARITYILNQPLEKNEQSLGLLTTEDRDVWAQARQHIIALSAQNADSFKLIDSALFMLCLDDEVVADNEVKVVKNFLHGDGINRWFDKSFSLIVAKDGTSAVNFEHSWGDGVAVLRYFQDIFKESNKRPFVDPNSQPAALDGNEVKQLGWDLDNKALHFIREAKSKYNATCKSLAIDIVKCDSFGKSDCKAMQVSPDAMMQLAFQVAYHRLYGKFVGTYESCSTAAFKHGRTETMRPCTVATKEFALAINSTRKTNQAELRNLLETCSKIHGNLTKDAAMGQGFDRHLFGLKHMANLHNLPLPALYKDRAYTNINHNIISTSTLSSEAVQAGGFGPVVKDGLGVGYSILKDRCGSVVTSYPPYRDGAGFTEALKSSLTDIQSVLKSGKC